MGAVRYLADELEVRFRAQWALDDRLERLLPAIRAPDLFRWSPVWTIFRRCQLYDFKTKIWYTYRGASRLRV